MDSKITNLMFVFSFIVSIAQGFGLYGCEPGKNCSRRTRRSECATVCPANYDPVCGTDGNTYSNSCDLQVAQCLGHTTAVIMHHGRCSDGDKVVGCRNGERPCSDGTQCVQTRYWCDGTPGDCRDGSDENNVDCPLVPDTTHETSIAPISSSVSVDLSDSGTTDPEVQSSTITFTRSTTHEIDLMSNAEEQNSAQVTIVVVVCLAAVTVAVAVTSVMLVIMRKNRYFCFKASEHGNSSHVTNTSNSNEASSAHDDSGRKEIAAEYYTVDEYEEPVDHSNVNDASADEKLRNEQAEYQEAFGQDLHTYTHLKA